MSRGPPPICYPFSVARLSGLEDWEGLAFPRLEAGGNGSHAGSADEVRSWLKARATHAAELCRPLAPPICYPPHSLSVRRGPINPRGNHAMRLKRFGSAISVIALFLFTTAALAEDAKLAAPPSTTAQRYGTWGVDLDGMDRSVKPGDDFFKYVNGKWAATTQIPADKTAYGAFAVLGDLSEARVHALLDRWAADKSLKAGSDEAKVAVVYRTYLDEATVENLDPKPTQPYLDAVKKAKTHEDMARSMGGAARGFGSSFFGASIGDDAKNPDKYTLYLSQ